MIAAAFVRDCPIALLTFDRIHAFSAWKRNSQAIVLTYFVLHLIIHDLVSPARLDLRLECRFKAPHPALTVRRDERGPEVGMWDCDLLHRSKAFVALVACRRVLRFCFLNLRQRHQIARIREVGRKRREARLTSSLRCLIFTLRSMCFPRLESGNVTPGFLSWFCSPGTTMRSRVRATCSSPNFCT